MAVWRTVTVELHSNRDTEGHLKAMAMESHGNNTKYLLELEDMGDMEGILQLNQDRHQGLTLHCGVGFRSLIYNHSSTA